MYSTENPVKYINVGFDVVIYKSMLLCVLESNERDMFKLVPVICGYRRLIVAKGFLHFCESGLLDGADQRFLNKAFTGRLIDSKSSNAFIVKTGQTAMALSAHVCIMLNLYILVSKG